MVKNPPANAADKGSVSGLGRSPGEGNSNPVWYSCLKNPMDRAGTTERLSLTQVIILQSMCILDIKLYTLNTYKFYANVISTELLKIIDRDFPGGPVVNSPPASTGDTGSIPGPGGFDMLWNS